MQGKACFGKGTAEGNSVLLQVVTEPPWKQSVVSFLLTRRENMHRQSCRALNPRSEIPSLM